MAHRQYLVNVIAFILAFVTNWQCNANTFIAYMVGNGYIVVGADSKSAQFNATDRFCKITILDNNHVFTDEGIQGGKIMGIGELAKRVFTEAPKTSTGMTLSKWLNFADFNLKQYFRIHPTDSTPLDKSIARGFFGDVSTGGSTWSAGAIYAKNPERTEWATDKQADRGPRGDFFSYSDDRNLVTQFFADGHGTINNMTIPDGNTMVSLVRFAIDRTSNPASVGGVPVVALIEIGKGVRWIAGGDICSEHPK